MSNGSVAGQRRGVLGLSFSNAKFGDKKGNFLIYFFIYPLPPFTSRRRVGTLQWLGGLCALIGGEAAAPPNGVQKRGRGGAGLQLPASPSGAAIFPLFAAGRGRDVAGGASGRAHFRFWLRGEEPRQPGC